MTLETVTSDVIHAIGYDNETSVLEIIFNGGAIYQYRGVPRQVFEELMRAESKGAYFQNNIRDEFEFWQWDVAMAKFIRGEQKKMDGGQPTTDN
jgi:hypothetical protein